MYINVALFSDMNMPLIRNREAPVPLVDFVVEAGCVFDVVDEMVFDINGMVF